MIARLASARIGFARLDYVRPVHWAAHSEDHGDCIVLELDAGDGRRGAAEAIMRAKWHDAGRPEILAALNGEILPALLDVDLMDAEATAQCLQRFSVHRFACALADQALHDMRALASGQPLWRYLGANSSRVAVSFTLTRTEPLIMAREAAAMRDGYGFTAFKIKTGQGLDIDRRAIAEIRNSLGDDAILMADSNRAHVIDDVAAMSSMLAQAGIVYFEDPCAFTADRTFVDAQARSELPILVDNQSRSLAAARTFLGLGAAALSIKSMKTGHRESLDVAALCAAQGAKVAVGISASGGAGAIHTLALAAAIPEGLTCLACEETFFLYLRNDLIASPLQVRDGHVELAEYPAVAPFIDWALMSETINFRK